MKTILLAAAAVIAIPTMAVAQEAPQTTTAPDASTAPAADPAAPAADTTGSAMTTQADPNATMPPATDAMTPPPATDTTGAAPAGGAMGTETAGGYQPSQPAISGTPQPGATVRFQPAPSPSQAFPPPAAEASYPICKKGQYDGCRQVEGGGKAKARRRR